MSDSENPSEGELILYKTSAGGIRIEVLHEADTFWLTQKKLAELFAVDIRTISEHLGNIFAGGELIEEAVIRKFRTTAADGKSYLVQFYNLDAIISVGYRVNSAQATQFRIWATQTLREFIVKGFVLDDERLKLNKRFGKELERVVSMYLDYAENQAERQIPMKMADWVKRLDAFLQFNEYDVLSDSGKVTAEVAKELAEKEYDSFRVKQDRAFDSDFEKEIRRIQKKKRKKPNDEQ